MSGLSDSRLLIASHIVPWSTDNRLNPRNGLCLSALHDNAFDRGLIALDDNFRVILSKDLEQRDEPFVREFFHPLAGQEIRLPERFTPDKAFLAQHRAMIFGEGSDWKPSGNIWSWSNNCLQAMSGLWLMAATMRINGL